MKLKMTKYFIKMISKEYLTYLSGEELLELAGL